MFRHHIRLCSHLFIQSVRCEYNSLSENGRQGLAVLSALRTSWLLFGRERYSALMCSVSPCITILLMLTTPVFKFIPSSFSVACICLSLLHCFDYCSLQIRCMAIYHARVLLLFLARILKPKRSYSPLALFSRLRL